MARFTIDFGIDLGTTNSAIAVINGTRADVFKNEENSAECTPSAVWIDGKGRLTVGQRAKDRAEHDLDNAFIEFKRGMGDPERVYEFKASGKRLKPQELSAEVLKSLKADVAKRSGEDIAAAVITIPAAFELPQCDATREAARLAGFADSPLLQEPVAAALTYGFQTASDRVFWLVFDFGGGTFDAAIMHVRDGSIQVVNHGGDNHLGGKDIDWGVVEHILIPALVKKHRLTDFRRGNLKWVGAIAKLKAEAERAKIRLSRTDSTDVVIDNLCLDDRGDQVNFDFELRRTELEALLEPKVISAINICKRVLREQRLGADDVEKVLLVGGPTLTPYFRQRLADELRIPLDFSCDPLTVVAQGAAIFAARQEVSAPLQVARAGQFSIALENWKGVGDDTEPLVGGRITGASGASTKGFTIEFVNVDTRPEWRSGKLGLGPSGEFMTNLFAEKGRLNRFNLELRDPTGRQQETVPEHVTYTVGIGMSDPPLIHSLGIALANNEVDWLVRKGTQLPTKNKSTLRTAVQVRKGQTGHVIRIPVVEGENRRADRNQEIGALEIPADRLRRDVPAGSEVEIVVEIDSSRIIRTKAFLPIVDEEFEHVVNYENYRKKARTPSLLADDLKQQLERLERARTQIESTDDPAARQALGRIDSERMVYEAESALDAAKVDPDAADKCVKLILDLTAAIDEVEDALQWPATVRNAEVEIERNKIFVTEPEFKATAEERERYAHLLSEIREAIAARDVDVLLRKVNELNLLGLLIAQRSIVFWLVHFEALAKKIDIMTNRAQAEQHVQQGHRAINNNDGEGLRSAVQQLASLLPAGDEDRAKATSSVMK